MPEILVIKPSSLGDIIHGLVVAESLKRQMPTARITWVAADVFAPLVESCQTVDATLVFERKGGLRAFRGLLSTLKQHRFDWVLDMQGLARSGLMTAAVACPRDHKVGRSDARELSGLAYGVRTPLPVAGDMPDGGRTTGHHAIDILREFLPVLGLSRDLQGWLSFDTKKRTSGVVDAVKQAFCTSDGCFAPIVLFPSSRRPEKEWQGFATLAEQLVAQTHFPVIWADSKYIPGPDLPSGRFLNVSGKTNLLDLVPLLEAASVVVCNDSGPMHLAAAMHRKVVACFGPTDPARYGPYPLNSVRHLVLVAPQGDLRQLSPEHVAESVVALLGHLD